MEKRKILIVDDEIDIRIFIAKFFEKKGYEAVEVESGLVGLNLLAVNHFDALISDIKMPYMDGLDFIRRAKKFAPDLVAVLLTGHGSLSTAQEAIRIGAHDYFTKPVDSEELYLSVEEGVKKAEERRKSNDYFISLEEEIRKEKENLELMEKDFLDLISHELRTPVTVISEGINFYKDTFKSDRVEGLKDSTDEQKARIFEIIENGRRRLVQTIEDITKYMSLRRKKVVLNKEYINLYSLLEVNFNTFNQLISSSGSLLKKNFAGDGNDLIYADKELILDVLSRLIINAAFHNPKGTEIFIRFSSIEIAQGKNTVISVFDNGKGIKKELLENIFKPFNVGQMRNHRDGLGLGLCICKAIIELHNGSIKVESQEGKGTFVSFEIPKAG